MKCDDNIGSAELLKKYGHRYKKKWGQNFIFDKNLLRKIAQSANILPGDTVIEIGPGAGNLTKAILDEGAKVIAIEIDPDLVLILRDILPKENTFIISGDVLNIDLDELVRRKGCKYPYKIIANLPYYITSPIIMHILEKEFKFDEMVVMVQWEVAQRLTARPGTKDYGAITLAVDYYTESKMLFKVPRHLFTPSPNVDSAVIALRRRAIPPIETKDKSLMFAIIKAAFNQRRKTLLNALGAVSPEKDRHSLKEVLKRAGVDEKRRGETLSIEEFGRLAAEW